MGLLIVQMKPSRISMDMNSLRFVEILLYLYVYVDGNVAFMLKAVEIRKIRTRNERWTNTKKLLFHFLIPYHSFTTFTVIVFYS